MTYGPFDPNRSHLKEELAMRLRQVKMLETELLRAGAEIQRLRAAMVEALEAESPGDMYYTLKDALEDR